MAYCEIGQRECEALSALGDLKDLTTLQRATAPNQEVSTITGEDEDQITELQSQLQQNCNPNRCGIMQFVVAKTISDHIIDEHELNLELLRDQHGR